jgi:hypothetical protein
VTIENIDVFAQRTWMGLQRVTEVITLGEHNWASMRSGIAKQYTFGTTITGSDVAAGLEPASIKNPRWHRCLRGFFVNQPKAD